MRQMNKHGPDPDKHIDNPKVDQIHKYLMDKRNTYCDSRHDLRHSQRLRLIQFSFGSIPDHQDQLKVRFTETGKVIKIYFPLDESADTSIRSLTKSDDIVKDLDDIYITREIYYSRNMEELFRDVDYFFSWGLIKPPVSNTLKVKPKAIWIRDSEQELNDPSVIYFGFIKEIYKGHEECVVCLDSGKVLQIPVVPGAHITMHPGNLVFVNYQGKIKAMFLKSAKKLFDFTKEDYQEISLRAIMEIKSKYDLKFMENGHE